MKDLWALAYHEAGHAVVALTCGGRVGSVRINTSGGATRAWFPETVNGYRAAALSSLAAAPAERLWLSESGVRWPARERLLDDDPTGDRASAAENLLEIPRALRPRFSDAEALAEAQVRQHWTRIVQLAERLYRVRRLGAITA
jgi:hypothetical protein